MLVVADFDNKTGDPVFDTALKQALAFQLQQSPFLKAMDEAEVRQTLKLSGRSPDAHVTGEIARDICIREGQKATLEGSIAELGSRYLIALQAVNCQTGETFAREEAEASGKEHVVDALGRATSSMRAKLGESLSTIQGENRAYQQPGYYQFAGSPSGLLHGRRGMDQDREPASGHPVLPARHRTRSKLCIRLRCSCAMAGYAGDKAQEKEATEKAYALRDRVSERERLFIEQQYYRMQGDAKKLREIKELLARRYPRDPMFRSNLASTYLRRVSRRKHSRRPRPQSGTAPRLSKATLLGSTRWGI